nr:MAG TPA: tail sheath protein [Caudoviricetes sp.]
MAIFYYTKQMFPHTFVEIHDYSEVKLPSSPLDNTNRQLSPVFADMGPDDRIMVVTMESQFTELYGKQTFKRHGLIGKAIIKNLRAGGWTYVRRLTDEKSKNANVSLNVRITPADTGTPKKKYYIMKTGTWQDTQPTDSTPNTDWVEVSLTKSPTISYASENHQNLKRKADAELVAPTKDSNVDVVPAYVLIRTGAGILGNKTEVIFQKMRTVSSKEDNIYQMDVILSENQRERYKINAVEDSRYDVVPLNIKQVLNGQSYQLNVHASEANHTKLAELVIEALGKLVEDLETAIGGLGASALAKTAIEGELAKVKVVKEALEEDDIPVTALCTIFGRNGRFSFFSDLLEDKATYIDRVRLDKGTNGDILKGKFDWNLQVNTGSGNVRIYEELCKNFFEGRLEPVILDFNEVPADVIYDIGYPVAVKEMIGNFTSIPKRRDIIATICPSKIQSIAELKSFDEGFKMTNYMCLKEVNWADYYDTDEQKTLNVPVTYLMINAQVEFVKDGWSNPILANRIVAGPIAGTITPVINILTDIEDKTYLVTNGWNYISSSKMGYFLDGQKMASTDPYKVSILQEYHNAFLIGRIMKKITDTLNRNRHFLQKESEVATVQAIVNKDLEEFRSKCASIVYTAYYEDTFAQAEGLLTHSVDLTLFGSNKSHKLELNVYRHLVENAS